MAVGYVCRTVTNSGFVVRQLVDFGHLGQIGTTQRQHEQHQCPATADKKEAVTQPPGGRRPRKRASVLPNLLHYQKDRCCANSKTFCDLNDFVSNKPVSLTMDSFGSFSVWRFDEAKGAARIEIVPIFEIFHPILLLDNQVSAMRFLNAFCRQPFDFVVDI